MYLLSNFGCQKSYGSENPNHLLYEYLEKSLIHRLGPPFWKIHYAVLIKIGDSKVFQSLLKLLLTFGDRGKNCKNRILTASYSCLNNFIIPVSYNYHSIRSADDDASNKYIENEACFQQMLRQNVR